MMLVFLKWKVGEGTNDYPEVMVEKYLDVHTQWQVPTAEALGKFFWLGVCVFKYNTKLHLLLLVLC